MPLRIIDVNLNRLDESLKLIEDITRFQLEQRQLLTQIRKIRIDFLDLKKALPLTKIIGSRRSQKDLGRKKKFDSSRGKDQTGLMLATLSRAKESSRIIEETLKTVHPHLSNKAKKIRFQIYDLEKGIVVHYTKKFDPSLHAIIDEKYMGQLDLVRTVKTMVDNGVTMIQLRVKIMKDKDLLRTAKKIRKAIHDPRVKFIINNRVDIALACAADGVHVGQTDIPLKEARRILGDMFILGASAHNLNEAIRAENQDADYLGVGAVFPTSTKHDARVCGLHTLKSISRRVKIPVIAIGGITSANYQAVMHAGAAGIAVASFLYEGNLRNKLRSLTH
ncbi:MAG: thiamine phosphate synthase [candidate division WOR-3 bacterium]